MKKNKRDQARLYPMWSNFMYFIGSFYSFIITFCHKNNYDKSVFIMFGILLLITGISSILYHKHTHSWNEQLKPIKNYKLFLNLDMSFAILSGLYGIFVLLFVMYIRVKTIYPLISNINFWFSLLFLFLGLAFYLIARDSLSHSLECKRIKCFENRIEGYEIFHSNWHIFTSIGAIFWVIVINNLLIDFPLRKF